MMKKSSYPSMEDPFKMFSQVKQQEVSDALWTRISAQIAHDRFSIPTHKVAWIWALGFALAMNLGILFWQSNEQNRRQVASTNFQYHAFHWSIYE
jgi:hypothetical protein